MYRMRSLRLFLVIAFVLDSSFSQEQDKACNVGDFCKYKCRCINPCQDDFKCLTNDTCQSGWFGYRCQYQNLAAFGATVTTSPLGMYTDWLTDDNDTTCNTAQNLNSVTFTWAKLEAIPLTWTRITVNDPRFLASVKLLFSRDVNSQKSSCQNETISEVSEKSINRRCNDDVMIPSLTLSGNLSSLCSFYISGGRNVAFNQHAFQSSEIPKINGSAELAVDGNTESNYFRNSCTHTNIESLPSWNLTLQSSYVIKRFIIYNRGDSFPERLRGFWVKTYDASRKEIGYYKDNSVLNKVPIYYVNLKKVNSAVNFISIRLNGTYSILTLCEVEAYGECPAGKWSLPCNKQCPTSCPNDCDRDTGKCNIVCIGYSNPPKCDTVCSIGKWGFNCRNTCSNKCAGSSCESKTGLCNQGCLGYSDPPYCKTECSKGQWGVNCTSTCNKNCNDKLCNHTEGSCISGCVEGYTPPDCLHKISSLEMSSFAIGFAAGTGATVLVILALLLIKTLVGQGRQKKNLDSVYNQTNLHLDESQNYDKFFKTDEENEDAANVYEESM